jgi:hypothetical protein
VVCSVRNESKECFLRRIEDQIALMFGHIKFSCSNETNRVEHTTPNITLFIPNYPKVFLPSQNHSEGWQKSTMAIYQNFLYSGLIKRVFFCVPHSSMVYPGYHGQHYFPFHRFSEVVSFWIFLLICLFG